MLFIHINKGNYEMHPKTVNILCKEARKHAETDHHKGTFFAQMRALPEKVWDRLKHEGCERFERTPPRSVLLLYWDEYRREGLRLGAS
jgi:hypothetical protein